MPQFITRAYNSFSLDENTNYLIKSSESERLKDELSFYEYLGYNDRDLGIFFPKVDLRRSTKNKIYLEYFNYKDLGSLWIRNQLTRGQCDSISRKISYILEKFRAHNTFYYYYDVRAMYLDKTIKYYRELVEKFPLFTEIAKRDTLTINGKKCMNFSKIQPLLEKKIDGLKQVQFNLCHGDLCFSNILVGMTDLEVPIIKLIDPRGKFGSKTAVGDPRYDYAKLMHSWDGKYEFIINDLFSVKTSDTKEYTLEYPIIGGGFDFYVPYDPEEVKLIQGLIFIGMCSRHYDSENRQLAMYLTGIRILNEVFE